MAVMNMPQLEYSCQDIFSLENILTEEPGAQRGIERYAVSRSRKASIRALACSEMAIGK
jgi:hypothetical protein